MSDVSSERNGLHDVCIVGAGPVGIALALECANNGLSVALLDAGPDRDDPDASDASNAKIADPRRHVPMDLAVRRGFGGTAWLWGGRCVPFNDIDFETRDYVPDSGWPIGPDDVRSWYPRATEYLDCGDAVFEAPVAGWNDRTGTISATGLEHFAREPKRGLDLRDKVVAHPRITLMVNCPVLKLDLGADGSLVEGVVVGGERPTIMRAREYVLACGGLETTRLLLVTQKSWPRQFGGVGGPLGRYYMGHFEGAIANVVFDDPNDIHNFDYRLDPTGGYVRRILTIASKTQKSEAIQNIVFWPDNLPFYDPGHRSGIKSFIYLLAETPGIGHRLVSEGIRLAIVGEGPRRYVAHALNILLSPIRTGIDIWGVIKDRFVSKRRKPGWLLQTPDNRYVLHYRGEQRPDPESRVTLADETDEFGMERLFIDLRYRVEDAESAIRAHDVLDRALRANGKGHVEYLHPREELRDRILAQASDGYHQLGSTRMGLDPAKSVVGPDCDVHGLPNLFIASCSVFPTGSHANPTLLATAMAGRLAARLASDLKARVAA